MDLYSGRYDTQGGDFGSIVSPELGRVVPEHVIGVHVNTLTEAATPSASDDLGLFIDTASFDAVAMEIAATLMFLGVPERERTEFNDIIERYRAQVIQTATV